MRLRFRIGKEGPPCGHGLFCYHNDPDIAEGLIRLWREWTLWWGWRKLPAPQDRSKPMDTAEQPSAKGA